MMNVRVVKAAAVVEQLFIAMATLAAKGKGGDHVLHGLIRTGNSNAG